MLMICTVMMMGANGQVVIQFNPFSNGQTVTRLGNVTLNNRYPQELECKLTITVREQKMGRLLTVTTPVFPLAKGLNFVPAGIFNKSIFLFAQNNEGYLLSRTRNFADGDYEYCFAVNLYPLKGNTIPVDYYENCFNQVIERATPMMLTNPYDREVSCNSRPVFMWQPSMPIQPLVRYTFTLVEANPKQSKAEAIAYNRPLIFQPNLRGNILNYPALSPALEKGKKYYWQVLAVNSDMVVARSEIWEYSIDCGKEDTKVESDGYRELKESRDEGAYITSRWLRFAFYNPYGAAPMSYTIIDLTEKEKALKKVPVLQMQGGYNKYELDLEDMQGLIKQHQYLLTMTMNNGKKLYLGFIYTGGEQNDK